MKKFIFFIAAMSALFSCVKENPVSDTPVVNTPAEETFSVEIRATAPSSGDDAVVANRNTKTTLVDGVGNNSEPKKFVHWSKGDEIKVLFFPKHTINAGFSGSNGVFVSYLSQDSAASTVFKCDEWSWGATVSQNGVSYSLNEMGVALYPSIATAKSIKPSGTRVICDTEVSFVLPSTQTAVKGNIESNLNFSYATVKLSEFSTGTSLDFKNACALIELTMPSTLDKKVTSISIASNNNVPLTGKGVATMSYYKNEIDSDPYSGDSDHIFKAEISNGAGVTLNNTSGFEAGAKYYVVVWPGKHDGGLTIEFVAEDGTKATKTTGGVELTASKVKPYTFNKGLVFESITYDYVYSDGSLGNEPNPSGKSVVGVIFFNGNPRENDPALPEYCTHGLAIGLTNYNYAFHTSNLPTTSAVGSYGIGTTNQYSQVQSNGNVYGYTSMTNWLMNFSDLNLYKQLPSPISNTSGWYVQTNCEWNMIASCFEQINEKLAKCGAVDKLETSKDYTTALGYGYSNNKYNYVYYAKISASYTLSMTRQNWGTSAVTVRPIFAF